MTVLPLIISFCFFLYIINRFKLIKKINKKSLHPNPTHPSLPTSVYVFLLHCLETRTTIYHHRVSQETTVHHNRNPPNSIASLPPSHCLLRGFLVFSISYPLYKLYHLHHFPILFLKSGTTTYHLHHLLKLVIKIKPPKLKSNINVTVELELKPVVVVRKPSNDNLRFKTLGRSGFHDKADGVVPDGFFHDPHPLNM